MITVKKILQGVERMSIVEVKNLTYKYAVGTPFEKTAVENVSFSINMSFVIIFSTTG